MRKFLGLLIGLMMALAAPAEAQKRAKPPTPEIPRCATKIGTVAIAPPENQWWREYNLGNPENLIKAIVRQSGCFTIVDRGRGLAMRSMERELGGELQRKSNVGAGQVKAADYFLVPDIVGADRNSGGNAVGAGLGGLIGGTVGGILGGISTRRMEARVVLSLINARTTEEVANNEGFAKKTDLSFGAGGFIGFGGVAGGGYESTDIGKVITAAYVYAYQDMVNEIGAEVIASAAETPKKAYTVVRATSLLSKATGGKPMKSLNVGDIVYPTGEKSGVMIQVADEFDITGWVNTSAIKG